MARFGADIALPDLLLAFGLVDRTNFESRTLEGITARAANTRTARERPGCRRRQSFHGEAAAQLRA
jgi:hypothetical protein